MEPKGQQEDNRALERSALIVATLTSFMGPFMMSSVNVALPKIQTELQMDAVQLSWIATAYLLAVAVGLVPAGKIADIHGRKKIFALGLAVYTVGSFSAAFVDSAAMLVGFRVIQGLGASMFVTTGMAILTSIFPPNRRGRAIGLYASRATIYALRRNLFNDASWPDFTRLPNHLLPAIRFHELESEVTVSVDGVRFTPIAVDHLVPTQGFLIEQGNSAVLWSSDTGPTERLWEIANRTPNLKALCIEVSFDNSMQPIADVSMHLTPRTLGVELGKLERDVPILLHHVKPQCAARIEAEVGEWGRHDIQFLQQGRTYEW